MEVMRIRLQGFRFHAFFEVGGSLADDGQFASYASSFQCTESLLILFLSFC